jgi:hypothetical protein
VENRPALTENSGFVIVFDAESLVQMASPDLALEPLVVT